jgi:hypothetical protein
MGTSYARATVAYQRQKIRERLGARCDSGKLRRGAYFNELRNSRLVVSPFGLGEITLKDFEVFMTGGQLLKPDMSHLDTWPDFFRRDETMAAFAWDFSDFDAVIDRHLADPARSAAIAASGQANYLRHVSDGEASILFADHLVALVADAVNDSAGDINKRAGKAVAS